MRGILLIVVMVLVPGFAGAQQRTLGITGEQRVALVIGNAAYKEGRLLNPVNDARAIGEALERLGFTVIKRENVRAREIGSALREFRSRLTPGAVALFFYAGHGLQVRGVNYLPAVDAEIEAEEDVANQSLDVGKVLELLDEAKTRVNLVFLDACRNNPFSRRFRSVSRGLAKVDAASGTLISFATRPGSVAADGDGKNGLYTEHLLNHMATPGLPVEQLLKRVGADVRLASKGRQEPWSEGLLDGDFYFRAAAAVAAPAQPATDVDATVELALWDSVKNSRSAEELGAYLEQFPKGRFAAVARARLKALGGSTTLAAAAPASALRPSAVAAGLPQVGDQWIYRLTDLDRKDELRQQRYAVNVTAVSDNAISERFTMESGTSGVGRHGPGGYLAPLGTSLFSPYLPLFQDLADGARIAQIAVREGACASDYLCDAQARVVGRETISVPAGRFDTIKVSVSNDWRSAGGGHQQFIAQMSGGRTITIWYAPEVKRAVKFASRLEFGQYPAVDANFDLELVSYDLKSGPAASAPLAMAAPPAPVQPARATAALPKPGDSWTYRLTDLDRKDEFRQQRYTVSVTGVSADGISERFAMESGPSGLARHGAGGYLAALGPSLFSPYLTLFQDLSASASIARVAVRDGACASDYLCDAQARVVGRETITTPAGRFDTVKVTVANGWRSNGTGHQQYIAQMNGARTITIWYAPEVKRAVKFSSRLEHGLYPAVDSNFDLELTGYQLK